MVFVGFGIAGFGIVKSYNLVGSSAIIILVIAMIMAFLIAYKVLDPGLARRIKEAKKR
ncbi:MAG TPA: hypothetical protein VMY36_00680 [Patescibacteria group bacterium]|nr:hypothetical protein [Patescibacteria group bacterium]